MPPTPARKQPLTFVPPEAVVTGSNMKLANVRVDFKEVRVTKHPWGSDTYQIAYNVIDGRVSPPVIFPVPPAVAHLFLKKGLCDVCKSNDCVHNNVVKACEEVIDHYEEVRETVFHVKLPEIKLADLKAQKK